MNRIPCTITQIESTEHISVVSLAAGDFKLKSLIVDTPETAGYLTKGRELEAIFKETEVILSKDGDKDISISNQISGIVHRVEVGELMNRVVITTGVGEIGAIIEIEQCKKLGIAEGVAIYAMVKINELMLSHD